MLFLSLGGSATLASDTGADDTGERFLEQLRAHGHEDLALEYLDRIENDPLASPEFRQRAPFERLSALVAQAATLSDARRRTETLAEAAAAIDATATPTHPKAASALVDARGKLALVLADVALRKGLAARNPATRNTSGEPFTAAQNSFAVAQSRLSEAANVFGTELDQLKGVAPDSGEGARRLDLRARLAQVRVLSARLLHEQAMIHPAGSPERKKLNQQAAQQLAELYEKYSRWVVGLYAHLYEGRCYRLLGEESLALGCFEDLISQPATTRELRGLVTLAQAEMAALRLEAGEPSRALAGPAEWLDSLPQDESSSVETAPLHYWVGKAALAEADVADNSQVQRRRLLTQAREHFAVAGRLPSEVQADARLAWNTASMALGVDTTVLEDFNQAYQTGKEAIATFSLTHIPQQSKAARHALEAALRLADEKSNPEQVNEVRYLLAWLDWNAGRDQQATAKARFVARRHPDDPSAEPAARLALAALERLAQQSDDTSEIAKAREQLSDLAKSCISQWAGSETASAAYTVLLNDALRSGDDAKAEQVLGEVAEEQRPELTLRYRLAQWEKAQWEKQKVSREKSNERAALRKQLDKSYLAARDAKATKRLLSTAALYLAQTALEAGDAETALQRLNAPHHGPVILLNASASDSFAQQTIITLVQATAASGDKDRVRPSLQQLDKVLVSISEDQQRRVLLTLGSQLRKALDSTTKPKGSLLSAMGEVLSRVESTIKNPDWNTTLWIAQTELKLGELGLDNEVRVQTASAALRTLLDRSAKEPGFAPKPTSVLAVRLQLAQSDRQLGKWREAMEGFETLLAKRSAMLEVQVAAAQTLQDWGLQSRSIERLEESIGGTSPGKKGKNLVWGWSKIAAVAARGVATNPAHQQTFFKAWLNVARSRYLVGTLLTGERRDEQFRKATNTIRAMLRQHSDLGGPEMRAQFDQLLRKIQTASGSKAQGLAAFKK